MRASGKSSDIDSHVDFVIKCGVNKPCKVRFILLHSPIPYVQLLYRLPDQLYTMQTMKKPPPEHLLKIKREIIGSYPDFEQRATKAWTEILEEMARVTETIASSGSDVRFFLLLCE